MQQREAMAKDQRRTLVIEDDLYAEIKRAALRAGAEKGEAVSISEWLRDAAREKLEREKRT